VVETPAGDQYQAMLVVDTRPLIPAVAAEADRLTDAARIARRSHLAVAEIIATVCGRIRARTGYATAVQSGGVFLNALPSCEGSARLAGGRFPGLPPPHGPT
jgi:hydrogenase maturation protein HypF